MKKNSSTLAIKKFNQFFKDFVLISAISIFVYMFARFIGFFLMSRHALSTLDKQLFFKLFSSSMYPVLFSYMVIIFIAYSLYKKTKQAMIVLHEQEIKKEREKAVIQTSQKISALMIQYVSESNTEIQKWLNIKRQKGNVPLVVENASNNINYTLNNFSKLAFVAPYIDQNIQEKNPVYIHNSLKQLPHKD